MVSQACADTERCAPFFLKNASVILRKKLELGADDAADPRNPDITAVKMAGKLKICSPFLINREKHRVVGQKHGLSFRRLFSPR